MRLKLALALLSACASYAAAAAPPWPNLSAGATVLVEVKETVSARQVHVNDRIRAKVLSPVLSRGRVVIPAGATLVGHVTSAQARTTAGSESRLGVRFERAEWKGRFLKVNAYIVRQIRRTVHAQAPATAGDCASPYPNATATFPAGQAANPAAGSVFPAVQMEVNGPNAAVPGCGDSWDEGEAVVHGTPVLKKAKLRRFLNPPGATELFSASQDIELKKGMLLELLQTGM